MLFIIQTEILYLMEEGIIWKDSTYGHIQETQKGTRKWTWVSSGSVGNEARFLLGYTIKDSQMLLVDNKTGLEEKIVSKGDGERKAIEILRKEFPRVKEVMNNIIQYVFEIDESSEQAYEKAFLAYRNIERVPIISDIWAKGSLIFRSRTHESVEEVFEKISDISYPHEKYVKNFARVNRPYQSVFYGSENRPTSYMELVEYWAETRKFGEKLSVTIGMWELQKDLTLAIIPIPNPDERLTREEKQVGENYDIKKKEHKGSDVVISDTLFDFLSKEFRKPAKNNKAVYIRTASISNLFLINPVLDGIIYPSVPFGGQGYNIVLRKSIIDNQGIKLIGVGKDTFQITESENKKHNFTQIGNIEAKSIDHEKGLIIW